MPKFLVNTKWSDWAIGIILALVVFVGFSEANRLYRLNTLHAVPAEAFFEPLQLETPDFKVGGDPILFYDRLIHQEFSADWIVEVQMIQSDGSPIAVCTGTGTNIFQPEKQQPIGGSHLSWFLGRDDCFLGAGTYRLVANWNIERPGAAGNVSTRIQSNLFKVTS